MTLRGWVKIFKALGNENRLKILGLLASGRALPVAEISRQIRRTVKTTSKHLIILANLDFLDSEGRGGSVWYAMHPSMSAEVRRIITEATK